jgi:hypothetical protein
MKTFVTSCLVLFGGFAGHAFACENPPMVAVPDGTAATLDEMVTAQNGVREYMAAMEEYLACLNEELEAGGEEAPAEFKSLMVTRHNNAVSEMETIAAAFNEQLGAYREANPSN